MEERELTPEQMQELLDLHKKAQELREKIMPPTEIPRPTFESPAGAKNPKEILTLSPIAQRDVREMVGLVGEDEARELESNLKNLKNSQGENVPNRNGERLYRAALEAVKNDTPQAFAQYVGTHSAALNKMGLDSTQQDALKAQVSGMAETAKSLQPQSPQARAAEGRIPATMEAIGTLGHELYDMTGNADDKTFPQTHKFNNEMMQLARTGNAVLAADTMQQAVAAVKANNPQQFMDYVAKSNDPYLQQHGRELAGMVAAVAAKGATVNHDAPRTCVPQKAPSVAPTYSPKEQEMMENIKSVMAEHGINLGSKEIPASVVRGLAGDGLHEIQLPNKKTFLIDARDGLSEKEVTSLAQAIRNGNVSQDNLGEIAPSGCPSGTDSNRVRPHR